MAVLRSSGGAGRRYQLAWQGATVLRRLGQAVDQALDGRAVVALSALRSELHRDTGEMAEKSFAEVSVAGGKRTLRIGSDAPHTAYHELGTSNYPAHPQIRQIADRIVPTITPAIRAALGGG